MAEAGLFIGFGRAARARETQAIDVLRQLRALCEQRRDAGTIAHVDAVLLAPHGGDLGGFMLLRGSVEQLDRLQRDEDFRRLTVRAGLVAERLGIVEAHVDAGFETALERYEEQVREQLAS